jgi:hypothetical protein
MSKNNKGRDRWRGATPKTTDDSRNYTGTDPFMAKPSRSNRQQKRGWQRGARK